MGVWAPPQNPMTFCLALQTPPSYVSKKAFSVLWGALVWVFRAPPYNPTTVVDLVHFKPHYTGLWGHRYGWGSLDGGPGGCSDVTENGRAVCCSADVNLCVIGGRLGVF